MMKTEHLFKGGNDFTPFMAECPEEIEFLIVDLFCGAGGTTTGFANAKIDDKKIALIIACVNHDPKAIKSHWLNHPEVMHFEEDIRTLDLTGLITICDKYRLMYPKAKLILWASLECTNFSKAKGGQPRDADSRTLADHLPRYIEALDPDYVQIENVVEFMSWGPLDDNGKPLSRRSGQDWIKWKSTICKYGYQDEWREINSADFGAYTSRNRLFGCFAKHGLPITWPEPTHAKDPSPAGFFGQALEKWKPVKDVLDFDDEGTSIFNRKKDLSPKTYERIYAGLIKYIAGGKDNFLMQYNSGSTNTRVINTEGPCNTIPTNNRFALAQTAFIEKPYSGRPEGKVIPVDGPAGTITCFGGQRLVQASFMSKYYGNGDNIQSINEPAGTLTTKDRFTKVQTIWIDREFKTGGNSSINSPLGTLLTVPKANLITATPFILKTGFRNFGSDIEKPSPVIDASRHHHYICNPSWFGHSSSILEPCVTLIARQDKAPLYLMQVRQLNRTVYVPVYPDDCKELVKIKRFMSIYRIADIKMRMLKVPELLLIQGFGSEYKLFGNQTDQKKFIGNSVHPKVPEHWCIAMANQIRDLRQVA